MSRLRFIAGRLSSRRICADGSARRLVHHQSKNQADDVRRSGRFSARPANIATAVTLSSALAGGILYFKQASGLTYKDAATPEEVITEEWDATKETAMKAIFEEWMVEYGRRYKSEKERTMRYREFKRHVKNIEKDNLSYSTKAKPQIHGYGCCEPMPTPLEQFLFMLHCDFIYRAAMKWWNQRRGM